MQTIPPLSFKEIVLNFDAALVAADDADNLDERGERLLDVLGAHSADQRQSSGNSLRVEGLANSEDLRWSGGRTYFAANRVLDPTKELDMGTIEVAGSLADPRSAA